MKKIIFLFVLATMATSYVSAAEVIATSSPVVVSSNGSPELTVSHWGLTNSQMIKIPRGVTTKLANGTLYTCPTWFPMYCVDVSATTWYKLRYSR